MTSQWTALYIAYSIVWGGVFLYLLYLHIRQKRIERDISQLKEEVLGRGK